MFENFSRIIQLLLKKGGTRTLQQVGQTFYAAYEKLPESIKSY